MSGRIQKIFGIDLIELILNVASFFNSRIILILRQKKIVSKGLKKNFKIYFEKIINQIILF